MLRAKSSNLANGQSVGGYTPQIPDSEIIIGDCLYLDCDSELNGDNSNCLDCAGIPNGTSEIDCLGICGDPNSENFAVTDLCGNCAGSCNSAPIIDCDCEAVYFNGINTIACNGNCNPDTYTDPCFIWNADTWIDNPGGQDFLYEPGEELNDINGNGLADIGCYDCGGNYISDENFDMGNVFREYSCAIPNLIFNTQFYCSDAINNNIFDDGSCLSYYDKGLKNVSLEIKIYDSSEELETILSNNNNEGKIYIGPIDNKNTELAKKFCDSGAIFFSFSTQSREH